MSDMLNRIKRRNTRPSVERNTSLVQPSESAPSAEAMTKPFQGKNAPPSAVPEEPTPAPQPPAAILSRRGSANAPVQSAAAGATAIEAELAALPQISQRRNIRLEVDLEERLVNFCQENDITVETFLEACFVEAEQNTRFRTEMATEAKSRVKLRKQAGKLRRVLSQLKK